ncbi:MAG TPA: zinc-binding dehydrogenase [Chloroflexota bacterium]|jgi:L-iditol 2-dehydrogenase|nr:zinc-binding dehydrogenase [Chloroflexota bacterium]
MTSPTEPSINHQPSTINPSTAAKAAVLVGVGGPFEVRELPVPEVRPGGVLLRMALSGVCATDAHIYKGDWPGFRFPAILGHENCARVAALGQGVETDFLGQRLAVGDLVVPRVASCGRCWFCLVGDAARWCPNRSPAPGVAGGLGLTGGWAELMYLESLSLQLFRTEAPPEIAVLTEPMATCVGGIERANLHLGETVVVQGAGPIGLLTAACARLAGAGTIVVVGGPAERLELAGALGADLTIDIDAVPDPAERTRRVVDATPRRFGADLVLGCVGHPAAVGEGLGYLRPGNARMVEIGNATGGGAFPMRPSPDLVYKNATLHGFWGTTTEHWIAALRVLERRALPFERVVSHQLPLARAPDAIAALNGDYRVDGRAAFKIAIAPNQP